MIRYTARIRGILNFVEKYGFITSRICGLVFYKDCKCKLDMGRRVLARLCLNKDLVSNQKMFGRELVYQFKKESISDHKYYLLNLYAEINGLVDNINYFKLEEAWNVSNKRSDAHIIFNNKIDDKIITKSYLIEFDKHNKTPQNKYTDIYNTGEVQEWYKTNYKQDNYFPDIIIVNYSGKATIEDDNFTTIGLDYAFEGLLQKIIL